MKFKNFYQEILVEKWDIVSSVKNFPVRVSISSVDIITTGHGDEQRTRSDNQGSEIKKEEIVNTLERSFPQIFQDYVNGVIDNSSEFLVKNKITDLNIVCAISMKKDGGMIRVVTCMRKKGFVAKSGTKTYIV